MSFIIHESSGMDLIIDIDKHITRPAMQIKMNDVMLPRLGLE